MGSNIPLQLVGKGNYGGILMLGDDCGTSLASSGWAPIKILEGGGAEDRAWLPMEQKPHHVHCWENSQWCPSSPGSPR